MRILVVEDDALVASSIKQWLVHTGYTVDLAASGEAAEISLEAEAFDLAVVDIGLPKIDGLTLIRRLRSDAEKVRQHTLEQAQRMLAHGRSPQEALEFISTTLTNRLIHAPSQRLRDAAESGDGEIIDTIAAIYHLDSHD